MTNKVSATTSLKSSAANRTLVSDNKGIVVELLRELQRLDAEFRQANTRPLESKAAVHLAEALVDNLPALKRALAIQAAVDEAGAACAYPAPPVISFVDLFARADELMKDSNG